jgi:23S rRNA (guanosine2251-2'-O)-methyltransferase
MNRLLSGPRAVEEALRADPRRLNVVYLSEERARELEAACRRSGVVWEIRSGEELNALAGGLRHQGALAIAGEYPYAELDQLLGGELEAPLLVALDQLSDPHNFGAIVRSSVAFGAAGVITLKDRAAPVTPVVVRASAGATERARIARATNLARTLQQLSQRGLQIIGLDAEGTALRDIPFERAGRVLVIGSEGSGLRRLTRERCDILAKIDLAGHFESLNASVAAGIALYESAQARAQLG